MKRAIIPILLFTLLLAACALPISQINRTPVSEPVQTQVNELLVKTQVSELLTQLPETESAHSVGTPLPAQPTVIPPQATSTPAVAATPSPALTVTQAVAATPTTAATAGVTPQASPTPAPSPNSTSTAAIPPSLPEAETRFGNPTWEDTFENDQNWPSGENTFTDLQINNRVLTLTGLSTKDGWRITWPNLKDFYLEATIKTGSCSGADRYGLIARVPDAEKADQGYLLGVTCDGKYSLRKWDGVHMTGLIDWTASKAIQAGANQTNRLGLLAVGDQLSVYINGTILKEITDSSFASGYFGLFVGASATAKYSINVTDIAYWENPKP